MLRRLGKNMVARNSPVLRLQGHLGSSFIIPRSEGTALHSGRPHAQAIHPAPSSPELQMLPHQQHAAHGTPGAVKRPVFGSATHPAAQVGSRPAQLRVRLGSRLLEDGQESLCRCVVSKLDYAESVYFPETGLKEGQA